MLTVVLDCSLSWARGGPEDLTQAIEQLLLFLNAFSLLSASNQLLLLASNDEAVEVLWPPASLGHDAVAAPSDARALRAAVAAGVQRLVTSRSSAASDDGGAAAPQLAAALAAALCRMHRVCRALPKVQPRMLLFHATEAEEPSQHLAAMNCVFAAQKMGVIIDALLLGATTDSTLLQHAAHQTGGLYLRPDAATQRAIAQYLITCCLPDRYARQFLRPPAQGQLETQACLPVPSPGPPERRPTTRPI